MIVENVNGDGDVNIQDLVLVDSNFGQRAPMTGDVNGDGVVNIADSVSGTMSNAAAAPAAGLEGER